MKSLLIWCDLNIEQDLLEKLLGDKCVSIRGATKDEKKIENLRKWMNKEVPILISKPSIFGYGLNFQHCHNMIFTGLSDSFEQVFQAERRCYRFGQKNDVNVHIVISEAEGNVKKNQIRKEKQFLQMIDELVVFSKKFTLKEIKSISSEKDEYSPQINIIIPKFLKMEI